MNRRENVGTGSIIVFDKDVKARALDFLIKNFHGDVVITKKLIIDKKIDIACNLYVLGGVVRKYPMSEFDINIDGDFYCYGEIHCHNVNVSGYFYSRNIIYSRNIKVGENFLCDDKVNAYGCNVIVAGDLECDSILAGTVECLGTVKVKGSISVAAGMVNGCKS